MWPQWAILIYAQRDIHHTQNAPAMAQNKRTAMAAQIASQMLNGPARKNITSRSASSFDMPRGSVGLVIYLRWLEISFEARVTYMTRASLKGGGRKPLSARPAVGLVAGHDLPNNTMPPRHGPIAHYN